MANPAVVSPRPYKAGERRLAATEATRTKILEAAREQLLDPRASTFSIDAIAERASVARMTVYYQFKSKAKLLEALLSDFGERANMREMQNVFRERDPRASFDRLIDIFCRFWTTQGAPLRRLNAMAALDSDVDRALTERGGWRRDAIAKIVSRLPERANAEEVIDVLHALTSLDTFDLLASRHAEPQIAAMLKRAAAAIVDRY